MKKKLRQPEGPKRTRWEITFHDEGKTFTPITMHSPYPITEVEAALMAMRGSGKSYSLNLKYEAKGK